MQRSYTLHLPIFVLLCGALACGRAEDSDNRTSALEKKSDVKKKNPKNTTKNLETIVNGLENNGFPLTSLSVSEGATILPVGAQTNFKVVGTYADESTLELSDSVEWHFSPEGIISAISGSMLKGLAVGQSQISAHLGEISSSGLSVEVTGALLLSFSLTADDSSVSVSGSALQVNAVGSFSDGQTYQINDLVTWSSSDSNTAEVSNTSGEQGLVTGNNPGNVVISANYLGSIETIPLTVVP